MSSSMRKLLEKASPAYAQRLLLVENAARSKFDDSQGMRFHQFLHSKRVAENIANLVTNEAISKFNSFEIFCLLSSAYLHDIGMQLLSKQAVHHDLKPANVLCSEHKRLGLSPEEALVIGTICYAHSTDVDLSSVPQHIPVGKNRVRVSFLAALLRLADALDVDFRRVPPIETKSKTAQYWEVYQSILGWSYEPELRSILIYVKDVPNSSFGKFLAELAKVVSSTSKTLVENGVPIGELVCKTQGIPDKKR